MHEMQGPHVTRQRADLPIPRLVGVLPGPPPYRQSLRGARSPGFRTTLGVAPAADFVQVVREFLLPTLTGAQAHSLILFKNLSPSTECALLSPHHGSYPPDIHSNMHKLGATSHDQYDVIVRARLLSIPDHWTGAGRAGRTAIGC